MSNLVRTGVLGGTFDPVHLGHRDVAVAAKTIMGLDSVLLVPARVPPHRPRSPVASGTHRLAMVELAAAAEDGLEACDMELTSDGPSFTSLTLEKLTRDHSPSQYFFITGADTFAEIASWHDYPAVLNLSHFVVVSRPGYPASQLKQRLPDIASRMRRPTDVSSTAETEALTAVWLVDANTRDISSSDIRARRAAGQSIDGLVAPSVANYVVRHNLYQDLTRDSSLQGKNDD